MSTPSVSLASLSLVTCHAVVSSHPEVSILSRGRDQSMYVVFTTKSPNVIKKPCLHDYIYYYGLGLITC